jgi:hypothetical protein
MSYSLPYNSDHVKQVQTLGVAWAGYILSLPLEFNWFCTQTFRDLVHPERGDKLHRVFMNKLNMEIWGNHYHKDKLKGVVWIRGSERQKRGALHYHTLVAGVPPDVKRLKYMDIWNELAGFAKIETPREVLNTAVYLTKHAYAFKEGNIDIGGAVARIGRTDGYLK